MRVVLAGIGIQENLFDFVLVEIEVGTGLVVAFLETGDGLFGLFGGDFRNARFFGGFGLGAVGTRRILTIFA